MVPCGPAPALPPGAPAVPPVTLVPYGNVMAMMAVPGAMNILAALYAVAPLVRAVTGIMGQRRAARRGRQDNPCQQKRESLFHAFLHFTAAARPGEMKAKQRKKAKAGRNGEEPVMVF